LPLSEAARANRDNEDFNILARLKPGISLNQAQADMDLIAARMKQQYPANYPPTGGLTISVVPLRKQVVGETDFIALVLFGAVGLVLLIACANVANLILSHAAIRGRESAIRTAVGASRSRLIRQLLTESALLGVFGGVAGVIVAILAIRGVKAFAPANLPRLTEVGIDFRVLGFTFLITLLTAIIFGLAPAMRASAIDLNEALKEGGRTATGSSSGRVSGRRYLTSKLLVISEVALSLVLLLGAGLLIRSYQRIGNARLGFEAKNVLALRLSLPAAKYATPESVATFYHLVNDKVQSVPGVEAVGTTYSLPMSSVAFAWEPIAVEGYTPKAAHETIISNVRIVSPGYFSAMRIRLVEGRYFTDQDKRGELETAIVDEAFAARFWPGQSPIGRKMKRGSSETWRTVVGVISDAKEYSSEKEPPITVYYPAFQLNPRSMYLVARTSTDPLEVSNPITRAIQQVDPEMPVFDVDSMEERLYDFLAPQRFSMTLLGVFAVIALVLASIGIYGVMANLVSHRTHEIGIRMALGARPRDVLGLVIRQGMTLVAIGTVIGIFAAIGTSQVVRSLLYGVTATDPVTLVAVAFILGMVALVACYLPAKRAANVDPMVALRNE
jgi:putative ABC transport system permease protein